MKSAEMTAVILRALSVPALAGEKISQPLAVAKVYCGATFDALSDVWSGTSFTDDLVSSAVHTVINSGYAFSDFATEADQTSGEADFRHSLTRAVTSMGKNKDNAFSNRQAFEQSMDAQELACLIQRTQPNRARLRKR